MNPRRLFYWFIWTSARVTAQILFGFRALRIENIPPSGAVIIASNHQSYLDPPMVAVAIRREIHFFAKQELFRVPILGTVIRWLNSIPVRRGVYDPAAINRALDVLQTGGALLLFPEGTRSDGVTFLKPKPGIGLIARRTGATIVPAYAYRTNCLWGALLARRRIKVLFGPPIPATEVAQYADDRAGYQALAERIMEHISTLRAEIQAR